ncbi:MAG: type II toxin-antitoxin system HicB family antitoxin [Isosphaerales bacterium]
MKIHVLIEPIVNDGFRATGGPPFEVTAQGTTREEALARLREAIDHRMGDTFFFILALRERVAEGRVRGSRQWYPGDLQLASVNWQLTSRVRGSRQ